MGSLLTAACQILPLGTPMTNAKVNRDSSENVMSSLLNAFASISLECALKIHE